MLLLLVHSELFLDYAAPVEAFLGVRQRITTFPSFYKLFKFSLAIALHDLSIILPPEDFEISGLRCKIGRVKLINLGALCKQGSDQVAALIPVGALQCWRPLVKLRRVGWHNRRIRPRITRLLCMLNGSALCLLRWSVCSCIRRMTSFSRLLVQNGPDFILKRALLYTWLTLGPSRVNLLRLRSHALPTCGHRLGGRRGVWIQLI